MKHLLVFGAGGFVGACLVRAALAAGWRVTAATRGPSAQIEGASWQVCDITQENQVAQLIDACCPTAVANLAARANIDRAESEQESTYQVNVEGARNIARSCRMSGARLVHFSTDAVFDGTLPVLRENDEPHPLNYYGYTKNTGDSAVISEFPQAAILRVSLALGFPVSAGNSFLAMLRARMLEGVEVFAPEAEIRTPIDIHTLCAAALETAQNDHRGLLNVGATHSIDRYTLTVRLAQQMGFDAHLVRRGGQPLPGRAPRHANGTLDVCLAQRVLDTRMLSLDETIEQAVL